MQTFIEWKQIAIEKQCGSLLQETYHRSPSIALANAGEIAPQYECEK